MLEWSRLTSTHKRVVKAMSERSYADFLRLWFQITQGQVWVMNWHHTYLCERLQGTVEGRYRDAVINITPGSGKTEMVSIHLTPWASIRCNAVRNLQVSSGRDLALRNASRIRDMMSMSEWQELWPSVMGKQKADEFQFFHQNNRINLELYARSLNGQIIGSRGGYLVPGYSGMIILDDPDKPADMLSQVRRENNHFIFLNTVQSRRAIKRGEETTPIVIVQQRLHPNDLSWLCLSGRTAIRFDNIVIPALVTADYVNELPEWIRPAFVRDVLSSEPVMRNGVDYYSFWPGNESAENLMRIWDVDEYTFMSQYQQQPFSLGGNPFRREDFRIYQRLPEVEYRFITCDTALKTGELNDYSVFSLWGKRGKDLYLLDAFRGKVEAPALRKNFILYFDKWWSKNREDGIIRAVYCEDKASGTGLIQEIARHMPVEMTPVQRNTDKSTRAKSIQPFVRTGHVWVPENEIGEALVSEAAAFTFDDSHPHDDFCDTMFDAVELEFLAGEEPLQWLRELAGVEEQRFATDYW